MIDEAQHVHQLRVGIPPVAADIDDPAGILGSEDREPRFQIFGRDPFLAQKNLVVVVETDDDRLFGSVSSAARDFGRSSGTPTLSNGAVTMKMTSNTSITSTIGVTLISASGE